MDTGYKYLHVKNWHKHQHYKDRSPPWIKLHGELFADLEFTCLQDASKLHLICIWLLARHKNGVIPNNPQWVKKCACLDGEVDLEPLISSGFLIPSDDASNLLATCAPEERRGEAEKRRGRGKNEPKTDRPPVSAISEPDRIREIAVKAVESYQTRRYKTPNPLATYYPAILQEAIELFSAHDDCETALRVFESECKTSRLPTDATLSALAVACGLKRKKTKPSERPSAVYKNVTAERLAAGFGNLP